MQLADMNLHSNSGSFRNEMNNSQKIHILNFLLQRAF